MEKEKKWIKVLDNASELHENRVMTVTANHMDVCLSRFEGKVCALDNKCPHQGGPLDEGSIENGLLRCPWHGWDYQPCTGKAPGFDDGVDTIEVKTENNKIYVALEMEEEEKAQTSENRITLLKMAPPEAALQKAEKMLLQSQRPVIIVGHGARFSMDNIIRLAEVLKAPVLTTFKAKVQISDYHPLAGGVLGRSGTPVASWLMNESDLLLVLGASFSNHTGITDKKPLIQVDSDPMALAKFHTVDTLVPGDVAVAVEMFIENLKGKITTTDQTGDIASRWKIWRTEKARRIEEYHGNGVGAIHIFDALNKLAPEKAVMTVDVGNNAYSFGRYYESKNNTFHYCENLIN